MYLNAFYSISFEIKTLFKTNTPLNWEGRVCSLVSTFTMNNLSHTFLCFLYIRSSWAPCGSQRTIWSPQASTASSSSQSRTDLAPHTRVCVCVCGPDWMTVVMTQSFLWAACFFFPFFFFCLRLQPSRPGGADEETLL